jgi:UDP-N-acetylglucosamine 4,6-dehydratase
VASLTTLDGLGILITGGTGSFGRACTQAILARYKPRRLVVFSRDEMKQAEMAEELSIDRFDCLRYFIGDVRDRDRLTRAMRGIDVVIHAAAMKVVPTAEYNPFECVRTNIYGAENVVDASLATGVKRVIALSTDKAVSPINLYGASKLAAEKIISAANSLSGAGGTIFSTVRYGNVLGSRGSVVQVFQRLIRDGADSLPITDPRMTRFWITLDRGIDFVLSSLMAMRGGEVFVPKIPSMRVVDLATAMAPKLSHRIIGIRPGEKLHESLTADGESASTVEYDNRFVIYPDFAPWTPKVERAPGGRPVVEGFSYASHTNGDWLDSAMLATMVKA